MSEWRRLMLLQFLEEHENTASEDPREHWKLSICCDWMNILVNRCEIIYFIIDLDLDLHIQVFQFRKYCKCNTK